MCLKEGALVRGGGEVQTPKHPDPTDSLWLRLLWRRAPRYLALITVNPQPMLMKPHQSCGNVPLPPSASTSAVAVTVCARAKDRKPPQIPNESVAAAAAGLLLALHHRPLTTAPSKVWLIRNSEGKINYDLCQDADGSLA